MSSASAVCCPNCRQPMLARRFDKRMGGQLELDLCFPCQGLWFDEFESSQLAPGAVIDLFKLIQSHREAERRPLEDALACPRCADRLQHGTDRVRSGVFNYHRCLQRHGRFTTFAQFMTEKGFVRQLSPAEISVLREGIGTVRCNSCGAPVDIRHDAACQHCRSPLVVLDPQAVEQALAGYHQAQLRQSVVDPAAMADAIIANERAKKACRRDAGDDSVLNRPVNPLNADLGDLLLTGVDLIWQVLRR